MPKYKVAVSGFDVIEVEADNIDKVPDEIFEQGLNSLYSLDIEEIVPEGEGFRLHTDLNE